MSTSFQKIDLDFFVRPQAECWVVTGVTNERPLGGLAAYFDWRFHGALSHWIRSGLFSGKEGECLYFPIVRGALTHHLIWMGAGFSEKSGERKPFQPQTLRILHKNLTSLRFKKVGVSRADFGNVSEAVLTQQLKGVPLWITE